MQGLQIFPYSSIKFHTIDQLVIVNRNMNAWKTNLEGFMNGVRSQRKIAKEQSCHLNDRYDVVVATFNMLCLPYLKDDLDT